MSAPHAWPTARLWSLAPLPSHIHTHFSVILVALGRVCAWCVCMRHRGWCGPAGAVHDRPFHRALGQLWSLCGGVPVRHLRCPDQPAGASRHGEAKPCAMCCYPLRMLCSLQGSLGQGIMLPIVPLPIVPKSVRVHVRACVRACVRGTDATVLLLHLLHCWGLQAAWSWSGCCPGGSGVRSGDHCTTSFHEVVATADHSAPVNETFLFACIVAHVSRAEREGRRSTFCSWSDGARAWEKKLHKKPRALPHTHTHLPACPKP